MQDMLIKGDDNKCLMNKTGKYEKYTEVVRDMLFAGINDFVSKNRP